MQVAQRVHIGGVDLEKILTPEERARQGHDRRLAATPAVATTLKGDQEEALHEFLDSKTKLTDADILTAIRLVMSTPEYQVT